MKTICLKFPDKVTAHSLLYSEEGEPLYTDIADNSRTGLCVEVKVVEDVEVWVHPSDGSYCADIAGLDEVPAALQPYVITPNKTYRKHKFYGEE